MNRHITDALALCYNFKKSINSTMYIIFRFKWEQMSQSFKESKNIRNKKLNQVRKYIKFIIELVLYYTKTPLAKLSCKPIHVQGIYMFFENIQNTFHMFKGSNYSLNTLFLIFLRCIRKHPLSWNYTLFFLNYVDKCFLNFWTF